MDEYTAIIKRKIEQLKNEGKPRKEIAKIIEKDYGMCIAV